MLSTPDFTTNTRITKQNFCQASLEEVAPFEEVGFLKASLLTLIPITSYWDTANVGTA